MFGTSMSSMKGKYKIGQTAEQNRPQDDEESKGGNSIENLRKTRGKTFAIGQKLREITVFGIGSKRDSAHAHLHTY